MAPSLFNFRGLRRRSKASFRTEHSTDNSSDAGGSGASPTSGSLTPPSVTSASDPSLLLHDPKEAKDAQSQSQSAPATPRPPLTATSSVYRRSISGMSGLGYPPMNGGTAPSSPYAPKIANVSENAWVRSPQAPRCLTLTTYPLPRPIRLSR